VNYTWQLGKHHKSKEIDDFLDNSYCKGLCMCKPYDYLLEWKSINIVRSCPIHGEWISRASIDRDEAREFWIALAEEFNDGNSS